MKVLFDPGTPAPLRPLLTQHEVATAFEISWSQLKNGELLDAAEKSDFELLITTEAKLQYQQHLPTHRIAIIVLLSASWPRIQAVIPNVLACVEPATLGTYEEIEIPYRS